MKSFDYITHLFLLEFIVGTKDALAFAPTKSNSGSINTRLDMVARNPNFAKLAGGYLFPEIGRRRSQYVKENPEMADRIVSLGIGDTTEPIPTHILSGLVNGATKLGTKAGYSGYGDVQGRTDLRAKIAETLYNGIIDPDEVFVSGTSFSLI
jgi:LL-diaminopimelate aminotransferase